MSNITSEWPLALAVVSTMACSIFVQAGEGAVFAIAPLVKRRMTNRSPAWPAPTATSAVKMIYVS